MSRRINKERQRFKQIVKGKTRERLKKLMKKGELIGHKKGKKIRVPLPWIDLPKIDYGQGNGTGTGQGDAQEGDVLGDPQEGQDQQAGDKPGEHVYEEFSLEEMAQILTDELELPNVKPKGKKHIYTTSDKLKTITRVGPGSRRHMRRTFKNALKRNKAMGHKKPYSKIIPIPPDKRYKNFKNEFKPEMNALIFYMMDVSGSMSDDAKEKVRIMNYWIDIWISSQYKGVESKYIIHDTEAKEVSRYEFYHTRESGGTMISSAYKKCVDILNSDYNTHDWNIYVIHSSDGDNWTTDDNLKTFDIIQKNLMPVSNMIGYAQVDTLYGSGKFKKNLEEFFEMKNNNHPLIRTTEIKEKDDIFPAIKDLFGKV